MQQLPEQKLLDALSQLLKMQKSPNVLSLYILMLPDHSYNILFQHLSKFLNESEFTIHEQFNLLVIKYISRVKEVQISTNRRNCYNLLENMPRTQSKQSLLFQKTFSFCLNQILQTNESNNKILCKNVIKHLQTFDAGRFWKQMHSLIQYKTPVQLREYFQNSFRRFMYQEFISIEDKVILRNLITQMKDKKPSTIAEKFMEVANKNYFKRNVVMYVVNLKKYQSNK
ncbi:Hypothetical_protein [Hexamita inflata]|uniref:Hypothetical_protein n=1 Tax=Hexamita inflata TaxID=28002 RepID=A0AA86NRT8_9EUKA|nr:Hypothetical protein HINF_LOCUS12064 [Hexamita inflata]